MYREVGDYVQTCKNWQRTSFVPMYCSRLKTALTRIFDTFSTDLAGPLFTTTRGLRLLLICVEHLTDGPLAYPTSSTTASEVVAFIK